MQASEQAAVGITVEDVEAKLEALRQFHARMAVVLAHKMADAQKQARTALLSPTPVISSLLISYDRPLTCYPSAPPLPSSL